MGKIGQLAAALRKRSWVSWTLATALVFGNALAQNTTTPTNPADRIKGALCSIYTNVLNNSGVLFAVVLIIVAWAGYMIYMGKREATDVIVKAVMATAIVLGAVQAARWILGNSTASC
jgi:hypothetical protein